MCPNPALTLYKATTLFSTLDPALPILHTLKKPTGKARPIGNSVAFQIFLTLKCIRYVVFHYNGTVVFIPRKKIIFIYVCHCTADWLISLSRAIPQNAYLTEPILLGHVVYTALAERVSASRKHFRVCATFQANGTLLLFPSSNCAL